MRLCSFCPKKIEDQYHFCIRVDFRQPAATISLRNIAGFGFSPNNANMKALAKSSVTTKHSKSGTMKR